MRSFTRAYGQGILTHDSLKRMEQKGWINDEIINSYAGLLSANEEVGIKVVDCRVFSDFQQSELTKAQRKFKAKVACCNPFQ